MKISEITEAKFAKPVIMYHGTNSGNLKSILSNGLTADRAGSGWASDFPASRHTRDLTAIGGVYLTKSLDIAYEAADESVNTSKERGQPMIVAVQYQTRHGYLDEDSIDDAISGTMRDLQNSYPSLVDAYVENELDDSPVSVFMSKLRKFMPGNSKHPELKKVVQRLIQGEIERRLSYEFTSIEKIVVAIDGDDLDADEVHARLNQESKIAEQNFRKVLERATVVLKNQVHQGSKQDNLRSPDSINFRGANKIIGIYVANEESEQLELKYGVMIPEVSEFFENQGFGVEDVK